MIPLVNYAADVYIQLLEQNNMKDKKCECGGSLLGPLNIDRDHNCPIQYAVQGGGCGTCRDCKLYRCLACQKYKQVILTNPQAKWMEHEATTIDETTK